MQLHEGVVPLIKLLQFCKSVILWCHLCSSAAPAFKLPPSKLPPILLTDELLDMGLFPLVPHRAHSVSFALLCGLREVKAYRKLYGEAQEMLRASAGSKSLIYALFKKNWKYRKDWEEEWCRLLEEAVIRSMTLLNSTAVWMKRTVMIF